MKKILKYFLFGIVLCLGLVAFSSNDNVMPFICHAVNSETCKVNFYGADNETLIFSRDIEKGTTLNEIETINLFNINYTTSTNHYRIDLDPSKMNENLSLYIALPNSTGSTLTYWIEFWDSDLTTLYYASNSWSNLNEYVYSESTGWEKLYYLTRTVIIVPYSSFQSNPDQEIMVFYGSKNLFNSTFYEPHFSDFKNFIDSRFLNSAGVSVLPSEYQAVEYIESTGTQYINCNSDITSDIGFEITANIDSGEDGTIFGNYLPGNYFFFVHAYSDNTFKFFPSKNLSTISMNIPRRLKTTFGFKNGILYDSTTEVVVPEYATYEVGQPLYLFAGRPNGSFSSYKLYNCKIFHGNTIVRDFVPCYRKSDGVIGLYDIVSELFFINSGTGTFNKGANIDNVINGIDISWSISPNSDSKFSFDSPINHDYNFYGFIDNGTTYNYDGNVDARLSEIGDYAIKDIVSFNIDGYYLLEIDFNSSSTFEFNFNYNDITSVLSNFENSSWKSFLFNSSENYFDLNFFVLSDNGSVSLGNNPGAQWKLSCGGNSKLYLSNLTFSYGNSFDNFVLTSNDYSRSANYLFDTNLGSLVDMNSDTNFSYQLIYDDCIWLTHNSDFYVSYNILSRVLNGFDFSSNRITFINPQLDDDVYYFSTDIPEVVDFRMYNNNAGTSYSFYNLSSNFNNFAYYYIYKPFNYDFSYNINNYYFVIDKPSYRVNNSLCIYNFDYYNTLSGVSSLTYELQKGSDYYDVTYVGNIPNSKFLYFDCPEIDNTIFNRYVFLYLSFTNSKIDLIKDNQYLSYSVGFDFNFIYYNQPLITSNGVYPYSFNVPQYKDMSITFSVVPPQLYIPWNSIFYNGIVFLCFYMPLVSDINNAIGLTYFIGALLNIIDYIFSTMIGQFITGCIAFLILFALMKHLFPFINRVRKNNYYAKH